LELQLKPFNQKDLGDGKARTDAKKEGKFICYASARAQKANLETKK